MLRILGLVLLLTACATPLHDRFFKEVSEGDSSENVVSKFGVPDAYQDYPEVPGSEAWIYRKQGDVCAVLIKDHHVINKACDSSNYISPGKRAAQAFGAALQGAGQGLQQGSQQQVHCVSNTTGATTYTDCH